MSSEAYDRLSDIAPVHETNPDTRRAAALEVARRTAGDPSEGLELLLMLGLVTWPEQEQTW